MNYPSPAPLNVVQPGLADTALVRGYTVVWCGPGMILRLYHLRGTRKSVAKHLFLMQECALTLMCIVSVCADTTRYVRI